MANERRSEEAKRYITIGAQMGDRDADTAVCPSFMRLSKLFTKHCSRGYGDTFKYFGFVLRIDGAISYWEKSGCDKLRGRRSGEATIDVYMPIPVWKAGPLSIQKYLEVEIRNGFFLMLEKLIKLGVVLDKDNLIADFEVAMAEFAAYALTLLANPKNQRWRANSYQS